MKRRDVVVTAGNVTVVARPALLSLKAHHQLRRGGARGADGVLRDGERCAVAPGDRAARDPVGRVWAIKEHERVDRVAPRPGEQEPGANGLAVRSPLLGRVRRVACDDPIDGLVGGLLNNG